jgi:protein-L-isoaspartate(D-aspartate) O-methyltransferase
MWLVVVCATVGLLNSPCDAAELKLSQQILTARWDTTGKGLALMRLERLFMVRRHLRRRDIVDERVLSAMATVPREQFVPIRSRHYAYHDGPLPIGYDQTISQPYIVALMTQLCEPKPGDRALEIGTGSGYQAAVLSLLVDTVYSVEIIPELTASASAVLSRLAFGNVIATTRDGYRGWIEHAPFDVILVTAAPPRIPHLLVEQLAPGGRMVVPVGDHWQKLVVLRKGKGGTVVRRSVLDVRFVPMTGEVRRPMR